jgi:uncharacterized protein involved in exopolysaccharide biosynthesis
VTAHAHIPPSPSSSAERESEQELSLLGLANVLLRHRRLVGGLSLLGVALAVGITLPLPRSFTSRSGFMPQTRSPTAALSGLAAQFGLALPTSEGGQSPTFYADLLESRTILGTVVDSPFEYQTVDGPTRSTLVELYKSKGKSPALRREAAIRNLQGDVEASTVQKTGMVNLEVRANRPELAQQINQRLVDLVNQFNLRTRQSQAGKEREFTERRLAEVRQDLRTAEDRLQRFLQRNRDYRNSPELTFQVDRLQREVDMQQQLFTTLAEAYEQAKIEEVRDTPVITVVQSPELPVRPDSRWLVAKALLGLLLGFFLGAGLALWKSYTVNSMRLGSSEAAEFAVLRREAMGGLLQPWRSVAQAFRFARRAHH